MNKSVIHIYGASGSGTSTLGRFISEQLGYTFMDTDDYFWLPTDPKYIEKREKIERLQMMEKDILNSDKVVISGSLVDWGDDLIPYFTLVVRLVTDKNVRIERLKEREKKNFGSRIEIGGDMYKNHMAFIEWAAAYDTGDTNMRSKAEHDQWERLLKCKQITVNGEDDLKYNLELIKDALVIE
ncbi:AAA family ATPase [Clostridium sp. YIM B02505]|uniref:AAA family ATPase n=1 Tax=Clostridium yunnanense TaxID=2800325 RepID=A0ABS1EN55_9CLOT|nr:AAA family ATPase [Clostridium yunnanense]MBK1810816.1 AAA family ATPase [Clostridium yunnanense]